MADTIALACLLLSCASTLAFLVALRAYVRAECNSREEGRAAKIAAALITLAVVLAVAFLVSSSWGDTTALEEDCRAQRGQLVRSTDHGTSCIYPPGR